MIEKLKTILLTLVIIIGVVGFFYALVTLTDSTMRQLAFFALWSILCVAVGVLLSRRLIITTTSLYSALWHDVQLARQAEALAITRLKTLEDKMSAKVKEAEKRILH